ncbi:hypothetical protein KF707_13915 [Candidatus Obscuribacterales bacterium]|nr:hypothetical protein [Candidatus Obscuribacterales bacterium]MBX3152097.1 hypothetical protein [Candidatus Obscuribacterales bacterium]
MFNRACWLLGKTLDVLHLPLAAAVLLFGRLWMSELAYYATLGVIVALQLYLQSCPLNPIVKWLIHRHDPEYQHKSIVERLYARFGKKAALIILTSLVLGSMAIARAFGTI